jgi:hypothetical protein
MEYQTKFETTPPHIDDVIFKFREDFQRIKKVGWMQSHRSHNTGIGKTFEDIIGVDENNSQSADYMNTLELKAQRDFTGSMITLFTKSPDHPLLANSYIREEYGVSAKGDSQMKIIHTTVPGSNYNSFKGKIGFKLEVNEKEERIYILVKNLQTRTIIDQSIYYFFETLQPLAECKCRNIAYIEAETKIEGEREYFRYSKATLLTNLTFRKFLDAIHQGLILYDIRIGVYQSGKSIGRTHDHGSGFRIKKADIGKVFKITEIA